MRVLPRDFVARSGWHGHREVRTQIAHVRLSNKKPHGMAAFQGMMNMKRFLIERVLSFWLVTGMSGPLAFAHAITDPQAMDGFQEVEAVPQVEVTRTQDPMVTLIKLNNDVVYQVGPPQISDATKNYYDLMTGEQKSAFHNRVEVRLKKLAQVLTLKKRAQGWFVSIADRVFRKKSSKPEISMEDSAPLSPFATSALLNSYNTILWNNLRSLGDAFDQKGVSMVLGLKAQAGFWNKPLGGAWFYVVNIGYNRSLKAMVVEVEKQKEKFNGGLAADLAIVGKFFFYRGDPSSVEKGRDGYAYYPPSIPFVGVGTETSEGRKSAGVYVSFGPDLLSYGASRNKFENKPIAVIHIESPLQVLRNIKGLLKQFISWSKKSSQPELNSISNTSSVNECRELLLGSADEAA